MITPFDADPGALDLRALAEFTDWQMREGIHGLIPLGSTGEFLSLTEAEREAVARCVIETVAGRVPVLIGRGRGMDRRRRCAPRAWPRGLGPTG
jgi:4-hydroxy-tetrahydrodipicolinate synthase